MRQGFVIATFTAGLCATTAGIAASSAAKHAHRSQCEAPSRLAQPEPSASAAMQARVLRTHNAERARLRLPPFAWSCRLQNEAKAWALALSRRGALQHASAEHRRGSGENLWMGTSGHWSIEDMVAMFLDERRHYRHGRFPDVSHTGNWTDVGHYSQIIWRETREVGCAIAQGEEQEVLVCRYFPAGNIRGRKAY